MVVIVGGGISGLSAAYYLAKAGVSSTLIEKRPRLGGVIQTERIDGCLVEGGPDSFLAPRPQGLSRYVPRSRRIATVVRARAASAAPIAEVMWS